MRVTRGSTGESRGEGSGSAGAGAGGSGNASGSSNTLDNVMRAPSRNAPEVLVIDGLPDEITRKEVLDPKEDLWLSTADGRYNAPMIPLRVGEAPYMETFYVHKDILLKADFFRKALCGQFKERESQSIELPEEDPAIFHFVVAFLYEDRYIPIKAAATVLVPDLEKGKGRDVSSDPVDSDSDSTASLASDSSARSRRRRERRRRREDRHFDRMRQKHPGLHRPNCNCPQCLSAGGPPCWHCAAPRVPPAPVPLHPPHGVMVVERERSRRRHGRRMAGAVAVGAGGPLTPPLAIPPPPPPLPLLDPNGGDRIKGEDLRTWLLAYELNLDVYICAHRFLLDDFKREVARACIDMLETAGSDAAVPAVLRLCRKLHAGLPENDSLLKMIFARVGFLQPLLWQRDAEATSGFLIGNPEVATLILRETATRRQEDFGGRTLPSLERPWFPPPPGLMDMQFMPRMHPRPRY